MHQKPWYASTCDRKTADDVLDRSNKVSLSPSVLWTMSHHGLTGLVLQDGAFMVRKSSGQDVQQPYTLVVFYGGRVYNIPIRFIAATKQYALGRQKRGEEVHTLGY